jgi:excisionase family DNA binding protein
MNLFVKGAMERLTLTVEETAKALGVGRTTAYELVRTGQIPSLRLGRRLVIPRAALMKLLEGYGSGHGDEGR